MQPDQCMYLHLVESEGTSLDLVLSTQAKNWANWWPGKWGILEERVLDDKAQQWFFSEADGSIYNAANPEYRLDQHEGWLYVADIHNKSQDLDISFPTTPRKWYYDGVRQELSTMLGSVKVLAGIWGQPSQWAWAEVAPAEQLGPGASAKWRIEYCNLL